MTIFRVEHNRNYTTINNTICRDNRLSWKAKGIWLYAFSRPDDWEFNISDLMNQSTDGETSVNSGLAELENCGYLVRSRKKDEKGRFDKSDYTFYEVPQKLKESLPRTGFPPVDNSRLENQGLLSTELPNTDVVVVKGETPPLGCGNVDNILTKDDIYHFSIASKKDWSAEEIEYAWKAFKGTNSSVSDKYAYIDGIIKKKRILEQNKASKEITQKKEKKCQNQNTNQSNMTNESESIKHKPSDFVSSEAILGRFDSPSMRKRKLDNS
jgi:hypothetical protein